MRLEKLDGRWVIPALGGAPANEGSIGRMLDSLAALRGELRSTDPGVLGDYGLQDAQAMSLALMVGGREMARLLVGKGDFRSVFIRQAGSPEAYAAPGPGESLFVDLDIFLPPGNRNGPGGAEDKVPAPAGCRFCST